MRKCLYLAMTAVMLAMLVLPVLPADADKAEDAYQKMTGVKVVTSSNTDVTYTGKHWKEDGEDKYEYIAQIHQAPIYNEDGSLVDCSWHGSEDAYVIVDNVFSAQVIGSYITVTYQGKSMSWNPVVMVDSKEYVAKGIPTLLAVDPVNENYRNNTLEWDYGVCVRRVRVIEGLIQETWTFDKDPKGNVWIRDYAQTQTGFDWAIEPYGYDANGNSIAVNEYKQVSASVMASAAYPVVIDPTEVFVTSASDGRLEYSDAVYATAHDAINAEGKYDTLSYLYLGQRWYGFPDNNYYVWRSYVYFDTSALPDTAIITSSILSLRGYEDHSTANFNIVIQSGQPTYPHDPLAVGDFDYTKYSGTGSSFSTAGFVTTGYNNISLTAAGLTYISLIGETKLALLSSEDIADSTPTGEEWVIVYSYEKGAGYRPTLYVTYVSSGPPDVTTNDATYVSKTSARLNGYLDSDGGEPTDVWFNYWEWYDADWSDCMELSINASYVDANLTNFPVLITGAQVNGSNPNFWTTVDVNGSDILFTDASGNKLYRELVSIDTTNMSMECYVNVSSVDATDDTPIYLYYGNPNASETNDTDTWNANYVMVHHMNDNPETSHIADSTANGNNGTKRAADNPIETEGCFNGDKAQDFTSDYITCGDIDTDYVTVEAIVYYPDQGNYNNIIQKYNSWKLWAYHVRSYHYVYDDIGGSASANFYPTLASTWIYLATTYGNDTLKAYFNDNSKTATGATGILKQDNTEVIIGARTTDPYYSFNGKIAEIRLSNIARSAEWILATYYSLMQPEDFCPVTDVFHSTTTQSKETGDSFYNDLSGLTADTLYGFRSLADQTQGMDYGAWLFFNTSVTLGAPSNALCNPTSSSISLTWTKGGNTSTTYIRYKQGGYPASVVDGNLLCNTSDIGYTHSGLLPGTTYYYKLWGQDGGLYSATNTTLICTTLAGGGATSTPGVPAEPDTWTDPTDETTIEDLPIYDIGNVFFDSFSLPHSTGWMAGAFFCVMASGFIIYSRSKNLLVAILTVMIFSIICSIIGLLPMWAVYCFAITSLGMSWKELR